MKVLFHIPFLNTIYAGRTIYYGYKNAFEDLGHTFKPWTAKDNPYEILDSYEPNILITSLNSYSLKYIDLDLVKKHKKRGLKVLVNTPFWTSPLSRLRINETPSLSQNKEHINLIKSGFGDIYYNVCEVEDPRMEGFEKATGYKHYTLPLAADKIFASPKFSPRFKADISFVGTNLPQKKQFFLDQVFPLKKKYDLKLYGQDWNTSDKLLGYTQKLGQYFNIPILRSVQKPKLTLEEERIIYASSLISINVHEDYQREFGGDCNERTFKIPLCNGFEITDDVSCIRKYFKEGKEIVIAKNKNDWFEKIEYYIKNPNKRDEIIKAGKDRVLQDHTYHNRVQSIISWF